MVAVMAHAGRSHVFPVIRIYSDDTGVTHFEDGEVSLHPGGAIGNLSAAIGPATVHLRATGADYDYDWHPTPARQLIAMMSGAIEIEVGDGERRTITVGQTLFLEDTDPPGHRTRNIGDVPRYSIFIQTDGTIDYRRREEAT